MAPGDVAGNSDGAWAPARGTEGAQIAALERALADPGVTADQILGMLRHPAITPSIIQRLSRLALATRSDRIRAAIVLHPRTPRPVALNLLSLLPWRDLARVPAAPRLGAPIRNAAEKVLVLRLPELALGEKITLARTATVAVLRALVREASPLVVRALLENPRLRLDDALAMAERADTPRAVLQAIADSPRFDGNDDLRLALAAHPATAPATALRLVGRMGIDALARLLDRPGVPALILVAATRRQAESPSRDPWNPG